MLSTQSAQLEYDLRKASHLWLSPETAAAEPPCVSRNSQQGSTGLTRASVTVEVVPTIPTHQELYAHQRDGTVSYTVYGFVVSFRGISSPAIMLRYSDWKEIHKQAQQRTCCGKKPGFPSFPSRHVFHTTFLTVNHRERSQELQLWLTALCNFPGCLSKKIWHRWNAAVPS